MDIIKDLSLIKKLSKEREEENWEFRFYLKSCDGQRIDKLVHRLYKEISEQIDCTECGNCCRVMSPVFNEQDIDRMSEGLGITEEEFKSEYLKLEDNCLVFKHKPCPFLKGNICTMYEFRTEECRSFPHLHKDRFAARTIRIVSNIEICPIIFNVYEALKKEERS